MKHLKDLRFIRSCFFQILLDRWVVIYLKRRSIFIIALQTAPWQFDKYCRVGFVFFTRTVRVYFPHYQCNDTSDTVHITKLWRKQHYLSITPIIPPPHTSIENPIFLYTLTRRTFAVIRRVAISHTETSNIHHFPKVGVISSVCISCQGIVVHFL